jgi:hypothetical protein
MIFFACQTTREDLSVARHVDVYLRYTRLIRLGHADGIRTEEARAQVCAARTSADLCMVLHSVAPVRAKVVVVEEVAATVVSWRVRRAGVGARDAGAEDAILIFDVKVAVIATVLACLSHTAAVDDAEARRLRDLLRSLVISRDEHV